VPGHLAVREELPRFLEPMLARSGLPACNDGWAIEVKWDGIRGQLRVDRGGWSLRSRPGRDRTDSFPELGELVDALRRRRVVLDGELVHLGADGKPDFRALRRRLVVGGSQASLAAARRPPVTFVTFDVLHLDGRAVRHLSYLERRELLGDLLDSTGACWCVPQHWVDGLEDLVAVTREHGLEGVVYKRLDGTYAPGRRTGGWLKHKHRRREVLAVTGWVPGDREPDTIFVARVGQDGTSVPAGSVQLGLDASQRAGLRAALAEPGDRARKTPSHP
jgi:bifunctional non-homologous end joining protein LigD